MHTPETAEKLLYQHLIPGNRQMKVMRLVGEIVIEEKLLDLPGMRDRLVWIDIRTDEYVENVFDEALKILARRDDIETFGNIQNWRFAEIRRLAAS